ncbi:MAG: hypothetical protein PHC49_12020 [Desulfuromonadaceae bacterium]|nr:hypothetical protein [Desulfuromonadaceae bacterium]
MGRCGGDSTFKSAKSLPLPQGLLLIVTLFFGSESPGTDSDLGPSDLTFWPFGAQQPAIIFGGSAGFFAQQPEMKCRRGLRVSSCFFCQQQQVWAALRSLEQPSSLQSPEHFPVITFICLDCMAKEASGLTTARR